MQLDIIQVLVQVPLVAAIIWFTLRVVRIFLDSNERAEERASRSVSELRQVIENNNAILQRVCLRVETVDAEVQEAQATRKAMIDALARLQEGLAQMQKASEAHDTYVRSQWGELARWREGNAEKPR